MKLLLSDYSATYLLHFFIRVFLYGIHDSFQFLPWHRWYIREIESLMKEVDCRVTIPYWDWSLVSADPWRPDYLFGNGTDCLGGRTDP